MKQHEDENVLRKWIPAGLISNICCSKHFTTRGWDLFYCVTTIVLVSRLKPTEAQALS